MLLSNYNFLILIPLQLDGLKNKGIKKIKLEATNQFLRSKYEEIIIIIIILAGYLEEMISDHTSQGAEQNKEHVLEDPGSTPPS